VIESPSKIRVKGPLLSSSIFDSKLVTHGRTGSGKLAVGTFAGVCGWGHAKETWRVCAWPGRMDRRKASRETTKDFIGGNKGVPVRSRALNIESKMGAWPG
jgi:hypothetical protein